MLSVVCFTGGDVLPRRGAPCGLPGTKGKKHTPFRDATWGVPYEGGRIKKDGTAVQILHSAFI